MEVSQLALARMLLCCFLGGVAMGGVYVLLMLPRYWLLGQWSERTDRLRRRLAPASPLRFSRPRTPAPVQHLTDVPRDRRRSIAAWVITVVSDTLFCLLCAVVLLVALYATNNGVFRLSALVALLCGVLLFRLTLFHRLMAALLTALLLIRAAIVWSVALVSFPLRRALHALLGVTAPLRRCLWRKCLQLYAAAVRALSKPFLHHAKQIAPPIQARTSGSVPCVLPDGRRVFCRGKAPAPQSPAKRSPSRRENVSCVNEIPPPTPPLRPIKSAGSDD